jgi:uncharacterized membrane protein
VPAPRLTNLDALRGFAVLLMIEQHVGIWLWRGPGPGETFSDYSLLVGFNAFGGFGGPLFFLLAGAGAALLATRGTPGTDLRLFKRGMLVLALGYVMNFASPSWFSWGSWFALHIMGFGIATSFVWRRLSDRGLLLVVAALMLAAPLMQSLLETPDDLFLDDLRDTSKPGGVLRLAFVEGQYPLLPWLSIIVLGFLCGRWIAGGHARRILFVGIALTVVGAAFYGVFLLLEPERTDALYFATRLKLGIFPPSLTLVCLMSGPAFVLGWAAVAISPRWSLRDDNPLVTAGRASLTIFFIHVPLFRELSRPIDAWSNLGTTAALAVVFAFIALSLVLSRIWQRHGYRYGAEWLLRKLAD